jgi:phage-related protein
VAIETFTWVPDLSPTGTTSFKTLSAVFGDGYEQTAEDGINNVRQNWPLTFTGVEDVIQDMQDFLNRHRGVKPFYFTPPLKPAGLYRAPTEYTLSPVGGDMYTLTVTFKQVFKP